MKLRAAVVCLRGSDCHFGPAQDAGIGKWHYRKKGVDTIYTVLY